MDVGSFAFLGAIEITPNVNVCCLNNVPFYQQRLSRTTNGLSHGSLAENDVLRSPYHNAQLVGYGPPRADVQRRRYGTDHFREEVHEDLQLAAFHAWVHRVVQRAGLDVLGNKADLKRHMRDRRSSVYFTKTHTSKDEESDALQRSSKLVKILRRQWLYVAMPESDSQHLYADVSAVFRRDHLRCWMVHLTTVALQRLQRSQLIAPWQRPEDVVLRRKANGCSVLREKSILEVDRSGSNLFVLKPSVC